MPYTLRELVLMAEGHNEDVWSVAAAIMAVVANCHISNKSKAMTPDDFLPESLRRGVRRDDVIVITKENSSELKKAFTESGFIVRSKK